MAAARVGGIHANNTYSSEFIYQNLMIECNIIHGAHTAGVHKLLFLGSSCICPKLASQPIKEEALHAGTLEPTNEPYFVAKIADISTRLVNTGRSQWPTKKHRLIFNGWR